MVIPTGYPVIGEFKRRRQQTWLSLLLSIDVYVKATAKPLRPLKPLNSVRFVTIVLSAYTHEICTTTHYPPDLSTAQVIDLL